MTPKNLQMFKDHGCTLKINLQHMLKQAKLNKDYIKTMNFHYLLVLVKELALALVINQASIDTREAKLQLSRTHKLLENEIDLDK